MHDRPAPLTSHSVVSFLLHNVSFGPGAEAKRASCVCKRLYRVSVDTSSHMLQATIVICVLGSVGKAFYIAWRADYACYLRHMLDIEIAYKLLP
jgi:hypothetical protein